MALHGISQKKREREKEGHGDPSLWWNKGALLNSVWIYIPYSKVASSDKDQKTRLYKLPRKQSNRGHKAKRQSISKEGYR